MAASKTRTQRTPRPRLPFEEKRRIVELALRAGASIRAITQQHGICRNSLRRWLALYRVGELGTPVARTRSGASGAAFLPVTIAAASPISRSARSTPRPAAVVEVRFPSGALLRIETDPLAADLIGALLAGLR